MLASLDAMLECLDSLEAATFAAEESAQANVGEIMAKILALQDTIRSEAVILGEQAQKQQRIDKVRAETALAEEQILELVSRLREAETVLANALTVAHEAQARREEAAKSESLASSHADIVSYARRLAKFTSPPANPNIPHNPPIPQDSHMKRSLLFNPSQLQTIAKASDQRDDSKDQPQMLMELDIMSQLAQNPTYTNADGADDEEIDLDL